LLLGPQRFTDLRVALLGVPPNLVSSRLRELEEAGLVARRELPPPAARTVYELTEDGRGLEPTVRALARWGIRRLPPPGDGTVSRATAVRTALVGYARSKAARGPQRTWAVYVGGEAFTLELSAGRVWYRTGEPDQHDLAVVADPADLIRIRRGEERPRKGWALSYDPEDRELIDEF
jgi:DNA-binding HxlR family transcriptional regulator